MALPIFLAREERVIIQEVRGIECDDLYSDSFLGELMEQKGFRDWLTGPRVWKILADEHDFKFVEFHLGGRVFSNYGGRLHAADVLDRPVLHCDESKAKIILLHSCERDGEAVDALHKRLVREMQACEPQPHALTALRYAMKANYDSGDLGEIWGYDWQEEFLMLDEGEDEDEDENM